jgi:hypothetical protein
VLDVDDHDRYTAFQQTLGSWDSLNEARVAEYLASARDDGVVGQSAVIDLIAHPGITEDVLEVIARQLPGTWKARASGWTKGASA